MSETLPIYTVAPAPVDPRLRVMLMALRRALLMAADAIGDYLEIPVKNRGS